MSSRLTEQDGQGNWGVKGLPWKKFYEGNLITKKIWEKLYGCLAKLKDYENTGLSPQQVEELMDKDVLGINVGSKWIPVSERLPEPEQEVLVTTSKGIITTAIYENGTVYSRESIWMWYECTFEYDEEEEDFIISEGWWEYKHYNEDGVHNNTIYHEVLAWMPLPKPYKE